MDFKPRTKIGKSSFWLAVIPFAAIFIIYLLRTLAGFDIHPPGSLLVGLLCLAGLTSLVSIFKYHDRTLLVFLSLLFGILGILLVVAEIVFSH